jgi:hypothetical protein
MRAADLAPMPTPRTSASGVADWIASFGPAYGAYRSAVIANQLSGRMAYEIAAESRAEDALAMVNGAGITNVLHAKIVLKRIRTLSAAAAAPVLTSCVPSVLCCAVQGACRVCTKHAVACNVCAAL